jgi:HSP20 family protein
MTGLVKYGIGSPMRTLRSEMDRLFDDFFSVAPARRDGAATVWAPVVDIREDVDNYIVEAELPGMKREEIEVELENNVLSIKGERKFERKQDGENYHFVERSYGTFYRSFSLPKNVDGERIGAEYKDGVLHVSIPKKEEVKPRKVEIKLS